MKIEIDINDIRQDEVVIEAFISYNNGRVPMNRHNNEFIMQKDSIFRIDLGDDVDSKAKVNENE